MPAGRAAVAPSDLIGPAVDLGSGPLRAPL